MSNTQNSKTSKAPGLFRWGGLVPLVTIAIGLFVFFEYLFDSQLKYWLSAAGATVNGAKIDIGELKTSFLNGTFEAKQIEIGNPLVPMRNRASIDRVFYSFLFKPVLEKKFVIKEASITGIQWGTERRESGVLANPPPKPKGPGLMDTLVDRIEKTAKAQASMASISQFTGIFSGNLDAQIERLGPDSNSFKKYQQLSAEISNGSAQWQRLNDSLPKKEAFQDYKAKAEDLGRQRPSRPDEMAFLIQKATALKSAIELDVTAVTKAQERLTGDIETTSQHLGNLDEAINEDIAAVRKSLKIPSLDLKDLSASLLGPQVVHWVTEAIYWADLSRKYFPKKTDDKSLKVEQPRARGTDVHFAKVMGYPTFLVEKALIQSNVAANSRAGNITGSILGLTTNPPAYGKPTVFTLKGEFPAARIYGTDISIKIDHVTKDSSEQATIKIDAFPLENIVLSTDPNLSLAIDNASGKAAISVVLTDDTIDAQFDSMIAGVKYKSSSARPELNTILKSVTGRLAAFEVKGSVKGSYKDLNFSVSSDLGDKLGAAISREFELQIAAINDRIKKAIESEIAVKKNDLLKQFTAEKHKALLPLEERLTLAKGTLTAASGALTRLEAEKNRMAHQAAEQGKAKANEKMKEAGENLKKSLKLPGF